MVHAALLEHREQQPLSRFSHPAPPPTTGTLLLAAGDDGRLRLFNAPCVVEDAPSRDALGHCSHLACARFLSGDRTIVSAGGADRSLMLWDAVAAPQDDFWQRGPQAAPPGGAPWRPQGRGRAVEPRAAGAPW